MKNFKRKSAVMAMFVASVMAVSTGCNFDNSYESTSGNDESTINPDAEIVLNVSVRNDQTDSLTMRTWAKAYEKLNKNVSINVKDNIESMSTIENWNTANTLPEIMWTAGDQHAYISSLGVFEDMNKFLVGDDENYFDDFYKQVMNTTGISKNDDSIYFMPRDYNQLVVLVNKTLLQDNSIQMPTSDWTWDNFIDINKQWKEKNPENKYYATQVDYSWQPFTVTMLENYNSEVYTDNALTVSNANTTACLTDLNNYIANNKYFTKDGSFSLGFSPFYITVRPNMPVALTALSNRDESMDVLPYPSTTTADNGVGYVGSGCSGYGISAKASDEKQAEAWKFLKFCMSTEGYEAVGQIGSIVPARKSLANTGSWTTYQSPTGESVNYLPFIESTAVAIDVNFCNNIRPNNQDMVKTKFQAMFGDTAYTSFDATSSIETFVRAVTGL